MIYKSAKAWQHVNSTIHRLKGFYDTDIVMLDLSQLAEIAPKFEAISEKTGIPKDTLMTQFQEICIDMSGLQTFVKGIIIRMDSFKETVDKKKLRSLKTTPKNGCQFDMLAERYPGDIDIGIDIPIQRAQQFPPPYISQAQLKKTCMFSVRVSYPDIEKLKFLKRIQLKAGTQFIHINLKLTDPYDLAGFQRFLVQNQFPIQSIILTTNLINVIRSPEFAKDQNLSPKSAPNSLGYYHHWYLDNCLSGSFANIWENFEIPYSPQLLGYGDDPKDKQLDQMFKTFVQVHKNKTAQLSTKGGFIVPPALLLPSLKHFSGGYESDLLVGTYVQRYSMTPIRMTMRNEFKTMAPAS